MQQYLNHPIVRYLVISITSIAAAVLFFNLGGSLAEISNADSPILGITFRAGGALAGALIFFLLSYRFIEQPAINHSRVKLHVRRLPKNFSDGDSYSCTGMVYNSETNKETRMPLLVRWEAGLLTVDFVNLGPNDLIGAEIRNQSSEIWRVHYFDPRTNFKEVIT